MLDRSNEFVLDAILSSNVADDASEPNSVGYYVVYNVVEDMYLYRENVATMSKFCAVASLIMMHPEGKKIVSNTIDRYSSYPKGLQQFLETKYSFPPSLEHFNIKVAISKINTRLVVKVSV
jgi:hypothetical protein